MELPYNSKQKMAKNNYLFVCIANIRRSKNAKIVFEEMCKGRGLSIGDLEDSISDVCVETSGVAVEKYGNWESRPYHLDDDKKYGLVFALDTDIKDILISLGADPLKIIDLEVKDIYDTDNECDYRKFRDLLMNKLEKYLPEKK